MDLKRIIFSALAYFFICPAGAEAQPVEPLSKLRFYTENHPPQNFVLNEKLEGVSIELLLAMLTRLGVEKGQQQIIMAPWARGITKTQNVENTLLFSTVWTPARDPVFKWIGPIGHTEMVLVSRDDRNIDVTPGTNLTDFTYVAVEKGLGSIILRDANVPDKQVYRVSEPDWALKMLTRGRVDMWSGERHLIFWMLRGQGQDKGRYTTRHSFVKAPLYIVANKSLDDKIVDQLQGALEELRHDGTFLEIARKYIGSEAPSYILGDER